MKENNKDIELRWHDLRTEQIPDDGCVILFPATTYVGLLYDFQSVYTESNAEFARINGLRQGYTDWFPIPRHPKEQEIIERNRKIYEHENDGQEQFYRGFERATENIIEFLKEIVPDRPNVVRAVKARFGDKEKE